MGLRRGDLVTVAISGDYGKPRPALILQSDVFAIYSSLTVMPVTSSDLEDAPLVRIPVEPNERNGLRKQSHLMVDKIQTVSRNRVGKIIGRLDEETMLAVNRALALFLGFA
jgi:mRNA interferase MazF